jgi:hypothetical protein
MPAIASLEDLKAAQKEGLSIYAMRFALCSLPYAFLLPQGGTPLLQPQGPEGRSSNPVVSTGGAYASNCIP